MKNIYNEFHFCCFIWVKFVPLFPCFTLNWCLNICLDQVKLSKKMTAGKRNDRKQPLWVVLRKSCFKKSEKPLKLVKKFRFPGKRKHHYCAWTTCLQGMLPFRVYTIFVTVQYQTSNMPWGRGWCFKYILKSF